MVVHAEPQSSSKSSSGARTERIAASTVAKCSGARTFFSSNATPLSEKAVAVTTALSVREFPQSTGGVPSVANAVVSPTASAARRVEALDLANQSFFAID